MATMRAISRCSVVACIAVAIMQAAALLSVTATAQSRPGAARAVPKFELEPAWLKLPPNWVLGQVSSTASDEQDHIWVLHRPRSVAQGRQTGPPVLEFDQNGRYLRGWGGPGEGYDWPESEHGIFVDYRGYVWIGGQGNEDQILKFTKDGKVRAADRSPRPAEDQPRYCRTSGDRADVFVYPPTNELFVSDGYGNKRVIVFDADTGAYKRMWGAFGNEPLDDVASSHGRQTRVRAARSRRSSIRAIQGRHNSARSTASRCRATVSCMRPTAAESVCKCSRSKGVISAQVWIDRWCLAAGQGCGNGETAASVAFSADREQRFLYVASRSPARHLGARPKIARAARFVRPTGNRSGRVQRAAPHDDRLAGQPLYIGSSRRPARSKVRVQGSQRRNRHERRPNGSATGRLDRRALFKLGAGVGTGIVMGEPLE